MQEGDNAVKILMEKGADPNTRDSEGRNALMVMSMENRSDASFGLPPGPIRVRLVWVGGRPELKRELPGGVPQSPPDRALQSIGEALLQAGCDINAADSNGHTPLMYAVLYNRPTAVRLLMETGANIKAQDKSGMTALDLAKQSDNPEIILLLQSAQRSTGGR